MTAAPTIKAAEIVCEFSYVLIAPAIPAPIQPKVNTRKVM